MAPTVAPTVTQYLSRRQITGYLFLLSSINLALTFFPACSEHAFAYHDTIVDMKRLRFSSHNGITALESIFLLAACLLYIHMAAPSVTSFGDHGELTIACWNLHSGHPPGYPLYVLLGRGFISLVPLGGVAFRLNLFSCLTGALAVFLVIRTVRTLTGSTAAGLVSGICLLFSPTFLSQVLISEVYALQIVLGVILAGQFLAGGGDTPFKKQAAVWFMCALAVLHHYTLAPLAALTMLRYRPRQQRHSFLLLMVVFLGTTPILLLPLTTDRGLPWGITNRISGLVYVLCRQQYLRLPTPPRSLELTLNHMHYLGITLYEDLGPFLLSIAVGILIVFTLRAFLLKKRFPFFSQVWKAGLLLLIFGPPAAFISNFPFTPEGKEAFRVLLLPFILMGACIGGLTVAMLQRVVKHPRVIGCVLVIGTVIAAAAQTGQEQTLRHDTLAHDYARNLLKSAPPGSIIVTAGGNEVFPLWFIRQLTRAYRVKTIDFKLLSQEWYRLFLQREERMAGIPITTPALPSMRSSFDQDLHLLNTIMDNSGDTPIYCTPTVWAALNKGIPSGTCGLLMSLNQAARDYDLPGTGLHQLQLRSLDIKMEDQALENRLLYQRYAVSLAYAANSFYRKEQFREALAWAEKAHRVHPGSRTAAEVLGALYLQEGWFQKAETMFQHLLDGNRFTPHLLYNRGLMYLFQNRVPDAIREWTLLSRIAPGYEDVETKLKQLKKLSSENPEEVSRP